MTHYKKLFSNNMNATKNNVTHAIFVIDQSGSMGWHMPKCQKALNDKIQTLKASGQQYYVSILSFADQVLTHINYAGIHTVGPNLSFTTYGSTALFDAISKSLGLAILNDQKDQSVLINIFTDGEENKSYTTLHNLKLQLQGFLNDRTTIAIECPRGASSTIRNLGLPIQNIFEWGTVEESIQTGQVALDNYITMRSRGVRSSNSYYNVTTDLTTVAKTDHEDVTPKFKFLSVEAETRIDEFYTKQTGKPYIKGSCWYQLTKPERVQPNKSVLLVPKGTKTVLGGPNTRKAIGLLDDTKDAKVIPGNHANWDVYIQSKMDNRKLVRGTKVLTMK